MKVYEVITEILKCGAYEFVLGSKRFEDDIAAVIVKELEGIKKGDSINFGKLKLLKSQCLLLAEVLQTEKNLKEQKQGHGKTDLNRFKRQFELAAEITNDIRVILTRTKDDVMDIDEQQDQIISKSDLNS